MVNKKNEKNETVPAIVQYKLVSLKQLIIVEIADLILISLLLKRLDKVTIRAKIFEIHIFNAFRYRY